MQQIIPSYGEEYGTLDIDVRYPNGDGASAHNIVMKIYSDSTQELFTEIKPRSEYPYFMELLPIGQKFRVDAFVNEMYSGSYYVTMKNQKERIDFIIPLSSGVSFTVFYEDGYTPLESAKVQIKSHTGKILRTDFTDKDGNTLRFWTSPTILENEFYQVEIILDENIVHKFSPLKLTPGSRKDLKIITPWPTIIDSLITIHAYKNNSQSLSFADGHFVVEFYDKTKNRVAKSEINMYGDAYVSLLPVGNYQLEIKDRMINPTVIFVNKTISILGNTREIEVIVEPLVKTLPSIAVEGIDFVPQSMDLDSKQELQSQEIPKLEPIETNMHNCNCVAFRLDDVQDYWLNDVQIEIMEIFDEKNLPLTIGIIGNEIGTDPAITSYINQSVPKNLLEIANHGWTHEDFTELDKETQSSLIKKINKKIQQTFGVMPSVFIPPYNEFDNGTISAMKENYITHFSSSIAISEPPFPLANSQLYNFPETSFTGELSPDGIFVPVNHKLTLLQIEKSVSEHGFAVVMMHPQDFSILENEVHSNKINWNQIRELELLLDRIKLKGLQVVPIGKINLDHENIDKIPHWVRQFSIWWSEGKISDEEYANGLKFYRENGINA
jgi:peptidoglycan/xylan/chitin deacetylase (PgdA/CDA1 family)